MILLFSLCRMVQMSEAIFSLCLQVIAPHLAETTSPSGSVRFAKLSKRELDKSCSSLLPCGAKLRL